MQSSLNVSALAIAVIALGATSPVAADSGSGQWLGASVGVAAGASLAPGGAAIEGRYLYELTDTHAFEGQARFIFGGAGDDCASTRCVQGAFTGRATQLTFGVRIELSPPATIVPWVRPSVGLRVQRHVESDLDGYALPLGVALGGAMHLMPSVRLSAELGIEAAYTWLTAPAENRVGFSTTALIGVEVAL
ncbi:MAG: hypothetical protein IPL79_17710 [Myxococcales bacterium]|nr:hypothetical protein [Myxococcales bacterium]